MDSGGRNWEEVEEALRGAWVAHSVKRLGEISRSEDGAPHGGLPVAQSLVGTFSLSDPPH